MNVTWSLGMGSQTLGCSAIVAGRENGFKPEDNRELAKHVAKKYSIQAITTFASMLTLEVWYYYIEAESLSKAFHNSKKESKILKKDVKKARTRTEKQSLEGFTEIVNGKRQFVNNPPLIVRLTDVPESNAVTKKVQVLRNDLEKAWLEYVSSVEINRRELLSRYHIVDTALRVVGVGSVGTRCFVALLEANSADYEIVLQ